MDIASLIVHPESLTQETLQQLKELVEEYPCFQAARLLWVKCAHKFHDPDYAKELERAAILLPTRKVLFDIVQEGRCEIPYIDTTFVAGESRADRTESIINRFLSGEVESCGKCKPTADPSTDYMNYLFQLESLSGIASTSSPDDLTDRTRTLIDEYMSRGSERIVLADLPRDTSGEDTSEQPTSSGEDNSQPDCYTETLAKICIRQERYERAIEILTYLHLNNPQKSIYFADQIRYLKKLVVNKKYKS